MAKQPFSKFEVKEIGAMEHWRNAFDSRFLRFTALEGKPRTVTITGVQLLKSSGGDESKTQLLITLKEFEKPWATNVTNSETIAMLYGDSPRGWVGKRVTLYPTKTKFGPQVVDCIRVRDVEPAEEQKQAAPAQQQAPKVERSEMAKAYIQSMADAKSTDDLQNIEEALAEDNRLSAEETTWLAKQLVRRTEQLSAQA